MQKVLGKAYCYPWHFWQPLLDADAPSQVISSLSDPISDAEWALQLGLVEQRRSLLLAGAQCLSGG